MDELQKTLNSDPQAARRWWDNPCTQALMQDFKDMQGTELYNILNKLHLDKERNNTLLCYGGYMMLQKIQDSILEFFKGT